jgi:hypothetical protein
VTLDGGRLLARPAPELEGLRVAPLGDGAAAPQMELGGSYSGAGRAGWALAPGVTALVDLDRHALDVVVDDGAGAPRRLSAALPERDEHALRVFVDGSLLEVFADDGHAALTTRAYPPSGAWARVRPVLAPAVRARAVTAWRLRADAIDR